MTLKTKKEENPEEIKQRIKHIMIHLNDSFIRLRRVERGIFYFG